MPHTIKTRTVIILASIGFLIVVVAMVAEWKVATWMGASSAIHNYHGICNSGVGRPYQDLIRQLRTIAETGDTNKLVTVLSRADARSRDIYDVWLSDGLPAYQEAYRRSIDEILK